MGTDWRDTPTPVFTDADNGATDLVPWPASQDEVSEFTDTGVLVPFKEFLNYEGFELVASLGDAMEDRLAAEIFQRNNSDTTLIRDSTGRAGLDHMPHAVCLPPLCS